MEGLHWDSESGELRYDLWEAQERAISDFYENTESDITDFRAGYRAGKSLLGARAIINGAWSIDGSRWLVMAESYKEGQRTTFRILFENLPEYDGDDPASSPIVESYHKQEGKLKLTNGSVIVFAYSGKVDGVKGDEYSGVWMDEVAFYNDLYQVNDMVMTRLSATHGPLSILWTTTTHPNDPFNAYYDIAETNKHPQTDEELPWRINTIKANSQNNPFLSDRAKEKQKRLNKHNKEQAIKGGFATVDGQVYPEFSDKNIVQYDDIKDDLYEGFRLYTYDSGFDDPRVVLEVGMTTQNQLVVLDEFYESETYIEDAIEWLDGKPGGVLVTEHEPEHYNKIQRDTNLVVVKAEKSIDDGIQAVANRLRDKNGIVGLMVTEECENTIEEFRTYTKPVSNSHAQKDHAMDCIRYLVYTNTPMPESEKKISVDTDSESNTSSPEFSPDTQQNKMRKRDLIRNRNRKRRQRDRR